MRSNEGEGMRKRTRVINLSNAEGPVNTKDPGRQPERAKLKPVEAERGKKKKKEKKNKLVRLDRYIQSSNVSIIVMKIESLNEVGTHR